MIHIHHEFTRQSHDVKLHNGKLSVSLLLMCNNSSSSSVKYTIHTVGVIFGVAHTNISCTTICLQCMSMLSAILLPLLMASVRWCQVSPNYRLINTHLQWRRHGGQLGAVAPQPSPDSILRSSKIRREIFFWGVCPRGIPCSYVATRDMQKAKATSCNSKFTCQVHFIRNVCL